jgi:DNA repair photolyase
MEPKEIECKSILVSSKLPDADYVVNPYTGCIFGCAYCYASFMGRFVNEPIDNWGNYLYVKKNAVEVFERDLAAMSEDKRTSSSILMSSVTDPYQGAEKKYRLVRGILEILVRESYPGSVSILTKSPLVLRDVDLLKQLPCVEVGMTVTTTDDKTSRFLEVQAPLASRRIDTLRQLNAQGIKTYAFVGPLLPHFRYRADLLEDLFRTLSDAGVRELFVEHMNLKGYIRKRLVEVLADDMPSAVPIYSEAAGDEHRNALEAMVSTLVEKYGFRLRLGKVLAHGVNS